MLGNFSFGDYFKDRAIPLAWELLTGPLGLDGDRLWVTVYTRRRRGRRPSGATRSGSRPSRIQRMGEDNFWEMGDTGPCGPCSEIYYDRGPEWGAGRRPGGGGGEERFVEIWNLVFMQYDRQPDGSPGRRSRSPTSTPAPASSGCSMILQDVPSDLGDRRPAADHRRAEALTGRTYGDDAETDVALRILADHARSMSFLISDGVFPTNEDRGYVLRRLIRRAVRQAYQLGVERPVTPDLVAAVVDVMGEAYPDLARNEDFVIGVAGREEDRFRATLRSGLAMLEAELAGGRRRGVRAGGVPAPRHPRLPDRADPGDRRRAGRRRRRGRLRGGHAPAAGAVRSGGERATAPTATAASTPTGRCSTSPARPGSWATPTARPRPGCSPSLPAEPGDGRRRRPQVEIFLDRTPVLRRGRRPGRRHRDDRDRHRPGPGGRHHRRPCPA